MKKTKIRQAEFTNWLGPLLDALRDLGGSGRPKEATDKVAKNLNIPDHILEEIIKSGTPRFANQVAWARQYLVWEGLLEDNTRGIWTLTEIGRKTKLTDEQGRRIVRKWVDIHRKARIDKSQAEIITEQEEKEPEDAEHTYTPSLLEVLQNVTPKGFEDICTRLLREHGFENLEVTGGSHDGGIDGYGTLALNPFVTIKVLFQCKRYIKRAVSRAEVGDFRNAMIGRAEKGIILTTGTFSEDAKREASRDGAPPVELIDGQKLVDLFKEKQLGVKPKTVYDVDLKFFEPFMDKKATKNGL